LDAEKSKIIQRVMDDLHEHTLSAIPSHFGKLAYLASLRDDNSALYRHYGLEKLYQRDECHQALLHTHRLLFYDWLGLTMAEQRGDLLAYLHQLDEDPPTVLRTWKKLEQFGMYPPAETGLGDRRLFVTDLRILLDVLLGEEVTQ
jgi:hypothetical protein